MREELALRVRGNRCRWPREAGLRRLFGEG